jgi:hypothetical protein
MISRKTSSQSLPRESKHLRAKELPLTGTRKSASPGFPSEELGACTALEYVRVPLLGLFEKS